MRKSRRSVLRAAYVDLREGWMNDQAGGMAASLPFGLAVAACAAPQGEVVQHHHRPP